VTIYRALRYQGGKVFEKRKVETYFEGAQCCCLENRGGNSCWTLGAAFRRIFPDKPTLMPVGSDAARRWTLYNYV